MVSVWTTSARCWFCSRTLWAVVFEYIGKNSMYRSWFEHCGPSSLQDSLPDQRKCRQDLQNVCWNTTTFLSFTSVFHISSYEKCLISFRVKHQEPITFEACPNCLVCKKVVNCLAMPLTSCFVPDRALSPTFVSQGDEVDEQFISKTPHKTFSAL